MCGLAAACPELPCLYQLTCCLCSFPGLSFHQQKCGKTSSVVNCCTSLHAHGADLLLLLLLTHSLGSLQPPASLLLPALSHLRSASGLALLPLTLRPLLPSPFPSVCQSICLSGGSFLLGQPSELACRWRRWRQLPFWPCPALPGGTAFEGDGWKQ